MTSDATVSLAQLDAALAGAAPTLTDLEQHLAATISHFRRRPARPHLTHESTISVAGIVAWTAVGEPRDEPKDEANAVRRPDPA